MSEQQSYNMANTWKAPRAMRYLASRLLREWQDAIESDPALRRYRIIVKRYEKEFEATVREFDKEHSESVGDVRCGNAAKLREVMTTIHKIIKSYGDNEPQFALTLISEVVYAALAAPPRNCDRFGGDYKMLNTAWFDWTGSPSGQNPDGTVKLTFAEWLLAPATEGGAK